MKSIYFLIFLSLGFVACKQQSSQEKITYEQQMKETLDVHDQVMGEMDKMGLLIAKLDEKVDSTKAGMRYQNAETSLKNAYQAMMEWMKDFDQEFPNVINDTTHYSQDEYKVLIKNMQGQKTSILAVRDSIHKSIAKAEKLLKQ